MKWNPLSRRHLLQGLGAALALPVLESRLPRAAAAQTALPQKTFIGVMSANGLFRQLGPRSELMPPLPYDLAGYRALGLTQLSGRHPVHAGSLAALAAANGGRISALIDSDFTPYLAQMTMITGLDYVGLGNASFHHHAQFGNLSFIGSSGPYFPPAAATLDQVLAYAPSFYRDPTLKGRAVTYTSHWSESRANEGYSFTFADPSSPATSAIVGTPGTFYNPATLWDRFFATATPSQRSLKKTLVDQVYADYRALRASPRLGSADRLKLDQHLGFLQDTQRRVEAVAAVCNTTRPPDNLTSYRDILKATNSVIVSLAACGLCHSFLGWSYALLSQNVDDWHAWAHAAYNNDTDTINDAALYASLLEQNRAVLKDMCLDLVVKLDQQGLLQSTVVACIQEHSKRGHEAWGVPAILFGSAGTFKTGQYLDYRNLQSRDDQVFTRLGYPINQLWANLLLACGVPRTEFEPLNPAGDSPFAARTGYASTNIAADAGHFAGHYAGWTGHDLSDWLPGIRA
jgi:hypothetical protein